MVGLPGTTLTAGLLNLALALVIWLVVRRHPEPPPVAQIAPATATASSATDRAARWFVLAAFLTGAASFMYELGWIRMLSLVLGSSTHSFELMLSAFIFGSGVRRAVRAKTNRSHRKPARATSAGIMVIMGVLAALTLPAYNLMFDFMAWFRTFTHTASGYVGFNVVSQSIAAADHDSGDILRRHDPAAAYSRAHASRSRRAAIGTIYSVEYVRCDRGRAAHGPRAHAAHRDQGRHLSGRRHSPRSRIVALAQRASVNPQRASAWPRWRAVFVVLRSSSASISIHCGWRRAYTAPGSRARLRT